jgi:hypothetical protein
VTALHPAYDQPPTDALRTHLTHFRRRVIEDALLEATTAYWLRRADDFTTVGTPAADETALACRRHAQLLAAVGLDTDAHAVLDDIHQRIASGAA